MIFPRLVYKCPGPLERAGGTYAQKCVVDAEAFDAAMGDGWHPDMLDAINPPVVQTAIVAPVEVIPDDNAPPTRAELEQKAAELGLKFDGRTSNAKLGKMIADHVMD
jgi:hypothetical protein